MVVSIKTNSAITLLTLQECDYDIYNYILILLSDFIYQELPSKILDSFNKESRDLPANVEQYVSKMLPISDSANVKKDLRKVRIDIYADYK